MAKDSESLHTIWPLINGHSKQESISDVGSQFVAMAKHIREGYKRTDGWGSKVQVVA